MQVVFGWQQISLQQLACKPANSQSIIRNDCSSEVLVQSVCASDAAVTGLIVVGDPCEDAAVLVEKAGKWSCLACYARTQCRHVKAAKGIEQTEQAVEKATADAWAERFNTSFDNVTGQRRVTSVSKVLIAFNCSFD